MPANHDLLLGKIAIAQDFCTPAQVEDCLRLQLRSTHRPPPPLGQLLLERGYLTPQQHAEILEIQQRNLNHIDPATNKRKEAVLFGKLAVLEGIVTIEEVNECLRLQAQPGDSRSLGEIMVAQGYLTAGQVKHLLGKQFKKIMSCPKCRLSFTVLTLSDRKNVGCPRCKGILDEGKPEPSVRTDAEFSTQIMRAVHPSHPAIPGPSPKMSVSCVICDHPFEAALDPTGRVRCPSCHTAFTPR